MCRNHTTHHSCTHTQSQVVLCLAALRPLIERATTFPFVQPLPAVAQAAHDTILSSSSSTDPCLLCTADMLAALGCPQNESDYDDFYNNSGAGQLSSSYKTLLRTANVTVQVEPHNLNASPQMPLGLTDPNDRQQRYLGPAQGLHQDLNGELILSPPETLPTQVRAKTSSRISRL